MARLKQIFPRLLTLLAALSLLGGHTAPSVHVHCADGTPCSAGMRDCCMPTPCAWGASASLRTCIVSISPGSDRVAPLAEKAVVQSTAIAFLPPPPAVAPVTVRLALLQGEHPPPIRPPTECASPRGPPRA